MNDISNGELVISDISQNITKMYLRNFSYTNQLENKRTNKIIRNEDKRNYKKDDSLFPSYYNQVKPLQNIKKENRVLAYQLEYNIKKMLDRVFEEIKIEREVLLNNLFKEFTKNYRNFTNYKKNLFDEDYTSFISFLLLCQKIEKQPKVEFIDLTRDLFYKTVNENFKDYDDYFKESLCFMMTIIFNLKLLVYTLLEIVKEKNISMDKEKFYTNLLDLDVNIWTHSINNLENEVVLSGCANESQITINPNNPINSINPNNQGYSQKVISENEEEVKKGASVANVLHKWRLKIFDFSGKNNKNNLIKWSVEAAEKRDKPINKTLLEFLQTTITKLNKESNQNEKNYCNLFGLLFQKTAGDFFQVKITQFLNDNENCFDSCKKNENDECLNDRYLYRPYSENHYDNSNNFNENYKRPVYSPVVQLVTFDIMAALIGLQQITNITLQTISDTENSSGAALYGTSNIGASVRKHIENEIKETNTKNIDIDIDLISVVRKFPSLIDNSELYDFLNKYIYKNKNELLELLDNTYGYLSSNFSVCNSYEQSKKPRLTGGDGKTGRNENINNYKRAFRLVFDYLCYYRKFRPEEAIARAKVIIYLLYKCEDNYIIFNISKSLNDCDSISCKTELCKLRKFEENANSQLPIISPTLKNPFFNQYREINNNSQIKDQNQKYYDAIIKLTFKEIYDKLIQKTQEKLDNSLTNTQRQNDESSFRNSFNNEEINRKLNYAIEKAKQGAIDRFNNIKPFFDFIGKAYGANKAKRQRQKSNNFQTGGRKNVTFHKHKNGKYINSSKSKTLKKTKKKKNPKDAYESLVKIFKELNFKM